ncbi:hypothetical protein TRFO_16017 [Tritrichomonas foetus]|uniref:Uncharacterized protein n=1 Tax=Tritrichomonas foetus TaxID=1144522 RepID=A0A1J4KSD0_9EUKA|nr:hypothetical protein TRFO_16017 [Tritrichomonas foetus]|eukprot:OHT13792.1 hypothetical protein TRFO_16017 [Tritrichomonas foetus]
MTGKREDSPREESFITVRFIVVVITVCMIVLGLGYLLWNSFRTVVGKDSPDERVPFKYSMKHQDKQHDDLELHGFSKL